MGEIETLTGRAQFPTEPYGQQPISVVIVDDHLGIAGMLRESLELHGDCQVLGLAADGPTGLALVEQRRPDVLILDLRLPGMDGIEVLQRVRTSYPQVRVLVWTGHSDQYPPQLLLDHGALGYVGKPARLHVLLTAVQEVAQGHGFVAADTDRLGPSPRRAGLTPRELQILELLVLDQSNKQIAKQLGLSPQTVADYITHLIDRFSVQSRTGLAVHALCEHLVPPPPIATGGPSAA
jgi:DNA-binding NarL/FixJ family response regulator